MRRRDFVSLLSSAAVAWPLTARVQQSAMPVIGLLSGFAANSPLVANFHRGLEESGFREGQNVALDYRSADGAYDRLRELAADLIKKRVSVIATLGQRAARAVKAARIALASKIPFVFSLGEDPVALGWKRVEALIARADTVVFVLSPDALRPGSVALKEVDFAASLNKRGPPIVFRPMEDKTVPVVLAKLNFIFFDDQAQFDASADRLAQALNTDIYWIRQHTEFGEQARRWVLASRPSGLLLRSPMLEQSEFWITSRPLYAPAPTEDTRAYISQSRQAATRERVRSRRVRALIYVLLVSIIAGLVGWINQAYVKEEMNWYMTMRPYRVANVDPYVLTPEAERVLKPKDAFRECAKDCPEMVSSRRGILHGIAQQ